MANKKKPPYQIFSISEQNADIRDILEKLGNKSQYICDAIREKFEKDKFSKGLDMEEKVFEQKVQECIMKLYGANITILASNSQIISQGSVPITTKETPQKIEESEPEPEDDFSRFKGIFEGM